MSLSEADIKKVAKLARIRLEDDQVSYFQNELSEIIDWIDMLQEVDTDGVDRMTSVANQSLPLREDKVTDGNIQEKILSNAPSSDYGCFVVPKVME